MQANQHILWIIVVGTVMFLIYFVSSIVRRVVISPDGTWIADSKLLGATLLIIGISSCAASFTVRHIFIKPEIAVSLSTEQGDKKTVSQPNSSIPKGKTTPPAETTNLSDSATQSQSREVGKSGISSSPQKSDTLSTEQKYEGEGLLRKITNTDKIGAKAVLSFLYGLHLGFALIGTSFLVASLSLCCYYFLFERKKEKSGR